MISYVACAVGSEKAEDICSIDVKERLKKVASLKKKKSRKEMAGCCSTLRQRKKRRITTISSQCDKLAAEILGFCNFFLFLIDEYGVAERTQGGRREERRIVKGKGLKRCLFTFFFN
jgi:hypothetical protein